MWGWRVRQTSSGVHESSSRDSSCSLKHDTETLNWGRVNVRSAIARQVRIQQLCFTHHSRTTARVSWCIAQCFWCMNNNWREMPLPVTVLRLINYAKNGRWDRITWYFFTLPTVSLSSYCRLGRIHLRNKNKKENLHATCQNDVPLWVNSSKCFLMR